MKKVFLILTIFGLAFATLASHDGGKRRKKKDPAKYCAQLKDGVVKVMYNGEELTANVTLEDGTLIRTDATVVKKDGTITVLKEGQCIDVNGKTDDVLPPVTQEKKK